MKIKVYECGIKAKLDDDFKKAVDYFKLKGIDVTFDREQTNVKLPEWNVRANLVAPNDGKYDVVMYCYDRPTQRPHGTGLAENFSKHTSSVFIPTGVPEDNAEQVWLIVVHEIMHCLFNKVRNAGLVVQDVMDTYLFNNDPHHADGNFARSWKNLEPFMYMFKTGGYKYFKESEVVGLKPHFVKMLDEARGHADIPFVITSGFRTPEHNKSVGGSPTSAHLEGLGCDLRALNWIEVGKIVDGARKAGITGITVYKDSKHVHLDLKPYRLEVK